MMKNEFANQTADAKKAENTRRIELGMLGELIERYPNEAREKLNRRTAQNVRRTPENSLVMRE